MYRESLIIYFKKIERNNLIHHLYKRLSIHCKILKNFLVALNNFWVGSAHPHPPVAPPLLVGQLDLTYEYHLHLILIHIILERF